MRKNKFNFPICFTFLLLAGLTACGQTPAETEQILPMQTEAPSATAEPAEPFTEEQLRQAISELKEDEASLARKQEY